MYLDQILAHNQYYVRSTTPQVIAHTPQQKAAVVTCMDCRLVHMLEDALGIERGDVIELRTAGATISPYDQKQKNGNDLIRSLATSIYLLGVREVIVIGHTQCGLSHVNPDTLLYAMRQLGIQPEQLMQKQEFKNIQELLGWIGAYNDVHINVHAIIEEIRSSPFLPYIPVHGLVIDIETGQLDVVERASPIASAAKSEQA